MRFLKKKPKDNGLQLTKSKNEANPSYLTYDRGLEKKEFSPSSLILNLVILNLAASDFTHCSWYPMDRKFLKRIPRENVLTTVGLKLLLDNKGRGKIS